QAGIPSARVNDVAGALTDPQTEARDAVVEYEHPTLGRVREVASPLRLTDAEPPLRRAPFRGEHTEQVLVEVCGYSRDRVRELADAGVLG
ncbi:MAG TPA: CoA transferase, partial [Thermoleophilaceae bacterium]|nr:CoA transferase [Thermoleophilaceae bacterium]